VTRRFYLSAADLVAAATGGVVGLALVLVVAEATLRRRAVR
jgi:hypothetical protein